MLLSSCHKLQRILLLHEIRLLLIGRHWDHRWDISDPILPCSICESLRLGHEIMAKYLILCAVSLGPLWKTQSRLLCDSYKVLQVEEYYGACWYF